MRRAVPFTTEALQFLPCWEAVPLWFCKSHTVNTSPMGQRMTLIRAFGWQLRAARSAHSLLTSALESSAAAKPWQWAHRPSSPHPHHSSPEGTRKNASFISPTYYKSASIYYEENPFLWEGSIQTSGLCQAMSFTAHCKRGLEFYHP